jgi:hypothetical protein
MDGNYAKLLQAARDIDTNAAAPLPICEDSVAAKALVQKVMDILPYTVAVLESAKKDNTARAVRECVVHLRTAARTCEDDSAAAKVFVQQVLDILPYTVAVLEGAKKDETARAVRECVVQLRTATRLLTVSA